MNNVSILVFALSADVILHFLDPGFAFFPVDCQSRLIEGVYRDLLGRIEHVAEQDTPACLVDIDRQ